MISDLAAYLTPAYLAGAVVVILILLPVINKAIYTSKWKKAGGVSIPDFGGGILNTPGWLFAVAKAHNNDKLLDIFTRVIREYGTNAVPGTVAINALGSQRYILTQEPEHMKTILTGKFAEFGKGRDFHRIWSPLLGDSIFTTDGKQWQDSRNMLRPMFIKNRVSDLDIFERWTQIMLSQISSSGATVDIQELYYRMTIDVITEFLLGESVNSLRTPKSEFVEAFGVAQRWQIMLTVLAPIEKLVPHKTYNDAIKVLEKFMLPIINRALALSNDELEKLTKGQTGFTFLHAIAQYSRDPKVVRDQLIAVLLAGRDTTASTLSWATGEMANNPVIWSKLRAEVLSVVGPDRTPSYEDLKGMKYLTNILNETLRLYPAVPFNIRSALQDSTLPSAVPGQPDLTVVKDDLIIYSPLAMQRRPDLYPSPSATFAPVHIFQPERWETWQPKAWQYIPFNGGPRICVGQQFALVEMAYVLVRMAQRFERIEYRGIEWENQYHKVEIVGCPGDSIKVGFFGPAEKSG